MEFKPVAYMEWAKLGSHAAVNLGRSGMSNLKLEDIGLDQKPKLVLLTNIHNPSGVLISRQTLLEVAQAAQRVGAWLRVDEVYLEYLSGEESRTAFGLADNIIVISSLTKVFGLGGLRCGWILAPNPLVPVLRRAMDHLFVEHVYIAEQLAARIFPKLDAIKEKNRARIAGNRETVERFMLGESVLAWIEPAPGGIICFPRVNSSLGGDGLAKVLMDRHSTVVVSGSFFEDAGHFRLGFGVKPEVLAKGLVNIRNAIQEK